jgi:hypothetical protein
MPSTGEGATMVALIGAMVIFVTVAAAAFVAVSTRRGRFKAAATFKAGDIQAAYQVEIDESIRVQLEGMRLMQMMREDVEGGELAPVERKDDPDPGSRPA